MNIYVSHSTKFDYKTELYLPLRNSELNSQHTFILPHEASEGLFNTKELFHSKGCDLVIAEVSYPSTGQGIELGWADMFTIPIVGIYKDGVTPAESVHTVISKFMMYTSRENMIEDITGLLRTYV